MGAPLAIAQSNGLTEFDACGVLVNGPGCVLFEGGGGSYVLADAGNFAFGDTVRVVGTLNPNCITLCPEADGCISGAEVVDPAVFPCGTPLPSFPQDIFTGVCPAAATGLLALTLVSLVRSSPPRSRRGSSQSPPPAAASATSSKSRA